ncbi:hypothetical protein D3C86_1554900 [compost metagenome]
MIGTKPQPAAQGEHFLTHRTVDFPWVTAGVFLCKINADLHRPAGMHRIERSEQRLPHWHHIDKVIKNGAELLLRFHRIQPFAVAFTVWRRDFERRMHQEHRDVHFFGTSVDLFPGDFVQPRNRRIGLIHRLLLRHRQHRADILLGRRNFLALKRFRQHDRPVVTIFDAGRHLLPYHACHINRLFALFQRCSAFFGASGQHQGGEQR